MLPETKRRYLPLTWQLFCISRRRCNFATSLKHYSKSSVKGVYVNSQNPFSSFVFRPPEINRTEFDWEIRISSAGARYCLRFRFQIFSCWPKVAFHRDEGRWPVRLSGRPIDRPNGERCGRRIRFRRKNLSFEPRRGSIRSRLVLSALQAVKLLRLIIRANESLTVFTLRTRSLSVSSTAAALASDSVDPVSVNYLVVDSDCNFFSFVFSWNVRTYGAWISVCDGLRILLCFNGLALATTVRGP